MADVALPPTRALMVLSGVFDAAWKAFEYGVGNRAGTAMNLSRTLDECRAIAEGPDADQLQCPAHVLLAIITLLETWLGGSDALRRGRIGSLATQASATLFAWGAGKIEQPYPEDRRDDE